MKTFLLTVFLCVSIMPLSAQKPELDMQGQWKLISYSTKEVTLNVESGKATVEESIVGTYGPEYAKSLVEKTEGLTENLRLSYLEINGSKFALLINKVVRAGTYKIKRNKKNKQIIQATFLDTTQSTVPLILQDGEITLIESESKDKYVFAKRDM